MKSTSSVPPALLHSLLSSVVQFMSTSGVETGRIERSFRASMRAVTAQHRATADRNPTSINIGSDSVAGAVLRAWHRDAAYVDEGAQPRPLRLAGRSPSLTALVRRQDAKCDVSSLIRDLLTVGLVRKARNGRYLPTAESATIGQLHPLAVEHVAKSVARLLETVRRNTDSALSCTPLIERYAHVPDLDPSDAKEFAAFAQQQGAAYLEAIDDWLETRRVQSVAGKKRRSRTKVAAGVHLVAYLGDQPGYRHDSSARAGLVGQGLVSGA
jgi:hypothetical protein